MDTAEGLASLGAHPLPVLLGAALLWGFETRLRHGRAVAGPPAAAAADRWKAATCGPALRDFVPEAAALASCALVAGALLLRGGGPAMAMTDPADLEAWSRITAAWPLLTTADSLIALQAMLRLPPLLSASLRPSVAERTACPAFSLPSAVALAAAACRVTLLLLSPYHQLDGPLGGWLHIAFEAAAVPLLLILACDVIRRLRCVLVLLVVVTAAACLASCHRLALADDNPVLDSLFTLAELLELAAAAAYLARTLAMSGGPHGAASSLMHAVLPLQQGLSMYYLLLAFHDETGLVGAGSPLALLQLSSTAQVGIYVLAATMHMTLCIEAPQDV